MRPKIIPNPTSGGSLLTPAITHFRAIAVKMGLKVNHLSERACGYQSLK